MAPSAAPERAVCGAAAPAVRHAGAVGAAAAPAKPSARPAGMPALKITSTASPAHASPAQLSLSLRAKPAPAPAPTGRGEPPRGAGGARKAALLWFRADLRLHDHEAFSAACADSSSVLPVYVFDPRDFGTGAGGFPRTGPARAQFVRECVAELRAALRARGSDLLVRVGRPEVVLPQLARAVGAAAVYAHAEVSAEERSLERAVGAAVDAAGAPLRLLWGSTLHHIDDLPFALAHMPANYGAFRAALAGAPVRPALPVPTALRRLPLGAPEAGELPTLAQLGVPPAGGAQSAQQAPPMRGGEAEALRRLAAFASRGASDAAAPSPLAAPSAAAASLAAGDAMYGASFSCKISPWLAAGCLSPRRLYEELCAAHGKGGVGNGIAAGAPAVAAAGNTAAASAAAAAETNLNWLVFEVREIADVRCQAFISPERNSQLIWRDFFRFITLKHSASGGSKLAPAAASVAAKPAAS